MIPEPEIGDHLVSSRIFYTHHGFYVGSGRVIHYAGNAQPGLSGPIEEVSLPRFCGDATFTIRTYAERRYTRQESVDRARKRMGEDHYCVLANNCEHFVEWCINGDHRSDQVELGSHAAAGTIASLGTGGGVGAVAATGTIAGLSGSGIMSGLATVGAIVGGGAVAGLAVLAAAPGAATTAVLGCTLFRDNPALEPTERQARHAGVVGSGVGALAATAGGVAAVSAMGTTAGLSAAGIASGLAAIGSSTGAGAALTAVGIGGGAMAGGVAVTITALAVFSFPQVLSAFCLSDMKSVSY
jgi:hypothetical protein